MGMDRTYWSTRNIHLAPVLALNPKILYFCFTTVSGGLGCLEGILDTIGSILVDYEPKPNLY